MVRGKHPGYGGGVSAANFLERLSKLIGDYDILSSSVSYNKGERGTRKQTQRHHIMEVSDLAAMPPGRAAVFPSGIPATMIRTVPWMARPDAGAVKASFARHDPGAGLAMTPQGANAWVAAGRPQPSGNKGQVAGPPQNKPVWEQSEEQRRGW